jgi:hypothetical protein
MASNSVAGSSSGRDEVATLLDITEPEKGEKVTLDTQPVAQHSPTWAGIARPFATTVFALVGLVIVFPFVLFSFMGIGESERAEAVLDWAKTVLPPVVGFASAVVGYYFGTRGAERPRPNAPVTDAEPVEGLD